jgi:hypothetical protein
MAASLTCRYTQTLRCPFVLFLYSCILLESKLGFDFEQSSPTIGWIEADAGCAIEQAYRELGQEQGDVACQYLGQRAQIIKRSTRESYSLVYEYPPFPQLVFISEADRSEILKLCPR